jgi:hypothetical protein
MSVSRQLMTPVSMNQFAFTGGGTVPIGAVAPAAGCDAAGSNTSFTAWGSLAPTSPFGIQYANNGSQWLWFYNGATATSAYILIGQESGGGVAQLYTQYTIVLGTTSYGFLGPFSPAQFNQPNISQFAAATSGGGVSGAPGGAILAAGQGLTCIDFLNTTTLAVRLYQTGTVVP